MRKASSVAADHPAPVAVHHVRALCLTILERGSMLLRDVDKHQHAKLWARTGLHFMICSELDEAERAFSAAARLLRETVDHDDQLELDLLLKGYLTHLAFARFESGEGGASMRQVLQHVEEAQTILDQCGASARLRLGATRLYLAEQCAFRVAAKGYELAELESCNASDDSNVRVGAGAFGRTHEADGKSSPRMALSGRDGTIKIV